MNACSQPQMHLSIRLPRPRPITPPFLFLNSNDMNIKAAVVNKLLLVTQLLTLGLSALANDQFSTGLSQDGVTGLPNTPSAAINFGQFGVQYSPRVIAYPRTHGDNLSSTIGLSESVEVGGRIAGNTWTGSAYTPGNDIGLRDLSGSFKVNVNSLFDLQLPVSFAAGAIDVGGAATSFRSYYSVGTYQNERFMASLGAAKAAQENTLKVLDGPFFNTSLSLLPWLSTHVESTPKRSWGGFKAQTDWLGVQTYFQVNQQFRGEDVVGKSPWWTVGFLFPLGGKEHQDVRRVQHPFQDTSSSVPQRSKNEGIGQLTETHKSSLGETTVSNLTNQPLPLSFNTEEKNPTRLNVNPDSPLLKSNQTLQVQGSNALINALLDQLLDIGFESVSLGWKMDPLAKEAQLVVEISDNIFMRNQLDGLGVALGAISNSKWDGSYLLITDRFGTPVQATQGNTACLRLWLIRAPSCEESQTIRISRSDPSAQRQDVHWVLQNQNPDTFKPRMTLAPIYSYHIATEVGMFDYSLGLAMNPTLQLWRGGVFEFSHLRPLTQTDNFKADQVFRNERVPHSTDRVMFHQMQKLPLGFSARASLGRIFFGEYQGAQGELRYDQDQGPWATGVTVSQWKSLVEGYPDKRNPSSAFVRYSVPEKSWNLEAQIGKYWFHDQGLTLLSRHWFGDTSVGMYLKRSIPQAVIWGGDRSINLAGVEVTIPLTPQKEMKSNFFQIKGTPQIGMSLFTQVGKSNNNVVDGNGVPVNFRVFVDAPAPFTIGSVLEDYDRSVFQRNELERLRIAYERFIKN